MHKTASPENCSICGLTFPGPITLQSHKRKAHGELVDGQTPRKRSRYYPSMIFLFFPLFLGELLDGQTPTRGNGTTI